MWKITLIAWLIFVILKWVFNIMIDAMSAKEKVIFKIRDELPMRLILVGGITLVELIISVIMTIITIIKW